MLVKNEIKKVLMMDLFPLSSQHVNWWTGVVWITCGLLWCFYQLFGLSFWRHPFTAGDPLQSKWCNATFLQIWWRNKLIYILDGLKMSTFSTYFHFGVNYYLKQKELVIEKNAVTVVNWNQLSKVKYAQVFFCSMCLQQQVASLTRTR